MVTQEDVKCFYIGNHGAFDRMALAVLKRLKTQYPSIEVYVVLAYMPGKKEEFLLADEPDTIYPEGLEFVPRRFAITHRNRWTVDQADYVVAYVDHGYGGAAQTLRYAKSSRSKTAPPIKWHRFGKVGADDLKKRLCYNLIVHLWVLDMALWPNTVQRSVLR